LRGVREVGASETKARLGNCNGKNLYSYILFIHALTLLHNSSNENDHFSVPVLCKCNAISSGSRSDVTGNYGSKHHLHAREPP